MGRDLAARSVRCLALRSDIMSKSSSTSPAQREIVAVETVFSKLGFRAATRDYAIATFRRAKDDAIYEYAAEFSEAIESKKVRELFYGLLWDLARADGAVGPEEQAVLRRMTNALGIRTDWYDFFARRHAGGRQMGSSGVGSGLREAYATLGVSPTASDDEIRDAYRELAKMNHPDLLRAQGLPDEMIEQATERMKRINDAWQVVRSARKS